MAVQVLLDADGLKDFNALPLTIQGRVRDVFVRLESWPTVSGVKALRKEWQGYFRVRTGDYRIIFHLAAPDVVVVRIQHRSEVYDE
jgi:mRNA interferase RelE/StbE